MGRLEWPYSEAGDYHLLVAQAENGMVAVVVGTNEDFVFPGAWIDHGGLRRLSDPMCVDRESAMEWCENEISKWKPIPKTAK